MTSDLKPLRERIGFAVTRGQSWVTVRVDDLQPLLAENERMRAQIKGRTLVPELVEKDREVARLKTKIAAALAVVPDGQMLVYVKDCGGCHDLKDRLYRVVRGLRGGDDE